MKTMQFSILTLILGMILFLPNTFAQDYTRWGLPEGAKARLGKGRISGNIAYSPDGALLAVASSIGIWLYDTGTYQEVALLTGHTNRVYSVAFSPDGNTLASGGGRQAMTSLRLWDVTTGQSIATLTGHEWVIYSVAFSPDGNTLASGSGDDTIRLWDVVTGEHKQTLTGHTGSVRSVAFSPDGNTLASGSSDDTIRLWDVVTGEHKQTLTGHTGSVRSVAFSPNGNTLASGNTDGTIHLWDTVTGANQRTFTGHTRLVRSTAFSPDGTTLASGNEDGTVLLWELSPTAAPQLLGDVNRDGVVNAQDLVIVAARFGQREQNGADVNGDGVVNIFDLVMVAGLLSDTAAAPSAHPQLLARLTVAEVEDWINQAQGLALTDATLQRGVLFLEHLLAALTPTKNALLPNYPNPFNPETWMPYQLVHAADVQVTIYDTKGAMVRQLDLGHQPAGYYTDRSKAAYWDGYNGSGESVASGVYFYQLRAEDYSATRRMVIVK